MTSSWLTLPFEIVKKIFSNLELTKDIQQAQLICKTTAIAQTKLYENIRLYQEDKAQLLVQTITESTNQESVYSSKQSH